MNEADTPKDESSVESLTSVNSPPLEGMSCPFDLVLPHEKTSSGEVPLLAPAQEEQSDQNLVVELNSETDQQDWVAEPDGEQQAIIDEEFKKLLALNEELRSDNSDLYTKVEELSLALAESDKALQWQKKRSSVTESMLNQQAQELSAAQEQVKSLYQQLETTVQTVQRQEALIETYRTQLETSQQRLAQLERECSLVQSNYNDQSHQLLQSENTCRELRTRLMRQQRQTLQFKAALEKCLETPVPNYDAFDRQDTASRSSNHSRQTSASFMNQQPIQPWSAEPNSLTNDVSHLWETLSASTPHTPNQSTPTLQSSAWETVSEEAAQIPVEPMDSLNFSASDDLKTQLDSVIEMFFVSQTTSAIEESLVEENLETQTAATAIWETSATTMVDDEDTEASVSPSKEHEPEQSEDYWSQVTQSSSSELPETTSPSKPFLNDSTGSQSPSPLIYPERPPKGRKSLAAVELPNFRPQQS